MAAQTRQYPKPHNLLDGKTVLITAAAGTGIGFAAATRCAEEGATVMISDIRECQGQLTTVRGDIEQLVAERDALKKQATCGTRAVGWSTPLVAVTAVQQGFDAAKIVDAAVAQLVGLGQGLLTVGIWLAIVGLPVLIVGLVVFGLVYLVARRLRPPRRPPVGPATGIEPV